MAAIEAAEAGLNSNPSVKQSQRAEQSNAEHAETPRRPACPSPLRPRPSPAARIARSLRAALWPSSAQAQSPAAPGAVAAQADAAYAAALARVRQRASALVAAVSGSPGRPAARQRGHAAAADPPPGPASSVFVLPQPRCTAAANKNTPSATVSSAADSPGQSSTSAASDPQFWGRGEVGVDGPLTLHMRDSPALSGMLAGIAGRSAGGEVSEAEAAEEPQPSRSISFGRGGVRTARVR